MEFDAGNEGSYTIIELHAIDHSGLLCAVADTFLELNVHIVEARINTIGQRVNDLFKVYSDTLQLTETSAQDMVRQQICTRIDHLPGSLIQSEEASLHSNNQNRSDRTLSNQQN